MSEVPPPPPAGYAPQAPMSPEDQRLWATLNHIGGIFFGWLSTLIIYLVLKDRGGFIRQHTRTALNFQLTMLLANVAGAVLSLVLMIVLIGFVTIYLIPVAIWVVTVVFSIIAATKANAGETYSYPLTIPFIK